MSNFNDAVRRMTDDAITRSAADQKLRDQDCPLCGARNRPDKLIIIKQGDGMAWCKHCSDSFPLED